MDFSKRLNNEIVQIVPSLGHSKQEKYEKNFFCVHLSIFNIPISGILILKEVINYSFQLHYNATQLHYNATQLHYNATQFHNYAKVE